MGSSKTSINLGLAYLCLVLIITLVIQLLVFAPDFQRVFNWIDGAVNESPTCQGAYTLEELDAMLMEATNGGNSDHNPGVLVGDQETVRPGG